jgi:ATP-binding cassette, subfamily B, heavy metal transporter
MGKGRTVITIAHRLSTIADADRIVVLEAGRIVEEGRHEELLARGGRYAAMWEHQSAEESETELPGGEAGYELRRNELERPFYGRYQAVPKG